jgi:hypothetical protein
MRHLFLAGSGPSAQRCRPFASLDYGGFMEFALCCKKTPFRGMNLAAGYPESGVTVRQAIFTVEPLAFEGSISSTHLIYLKS